MKNKKKYFDKFVVSFINRNFSYKNLSMDMDCIEEPLTGKRCNLSAVDLLALYYALSDYFEIEIDFLDIYTFWSANSISQYLMNLNSERIFSHVLSEVEGENACDCKKDGTTSG